MIVGTQKQQGLDESARCVTSADGVILRGERPQLTATLESLCD